MSTKFGVLIFKESQVRTHVPQQRHNVAENISHTQIRIKTLTNNAYKIIWHSLSTGLTTCSRHSKLAVCHCFCFTDNIERIGVILSKKCSPLSGSQVNRVLLYVRNYADSESKVRFAPLRHIVSLMTVYHYLIDSIGASAIKKQNTTYFPTNNIQTQMNFPKKHQNWDLEAWEKVLWSDESPFELYVTRNLNNDSVWTKTAKMSRAFRK